MRHKVGVHIVGWPHPISCSPTDISLNLIVHGEIEWM